MCVTVVSLASKGMMGSLVRTVVPLGAVTLIKKLPGPGPVMDIQPRPAMTMSLLALPQEVPSICHFIPSLHHHRIMLIKKHDREQKEKQVSMCERHTHTQRTRDR